MSPDFTSSPSFTFTLSIVPGIGADTTSEPSDTTTSFFSSTFGAAWGAGLDLAWGATFGY